MAKVTAKKSATVAKKASTGKPKTNTAGIDALEKFGVDVLKKFQSLGIEQQLQADLEWCLGSFRHDKNPTGLLDMINQSVAVLKIEQNKKTKGVTTKLISDLEKVLKSK